MASNHTPTPWVIDRDYRPGMSWNNHIVSEAEPATTICFMSHDGTDENAVGEANAALIVAAVNAYEANKAQIAELEAALEWYGENSRLCRLIHSEGDAGRHALQADGGKRARAILERSNGE